DWGEELGRILQIPVHHDDGGTLCRVHAGGDRNLVPEVAGQADVLAAMVVTRFRLEHDRTAVGAAVVDENRLGRCVELIHQRIDAPQKDGQDGFFVKNGNHDAVAHGDGRVTGHGTDLIPD